MTDFPRGWTLNNTQNGTSAAASITVPAVAGVVHVLDSLFCAIMNEGAAARYMPNLTVVTGVGTILTTSLQVPAMTAARDSNFFNGLDIPSLPGGTIVVSFTSAAIASIWEEITIQGHDI